MIPNNSEQFQSTGTHIGVPATGNVPTPQVVQPPTPHDYLALLPVLITAATPLILGLKKNKDKEMRTR
jgi:hypothetical protein